MKQLVWALIAALGVCACGGTETGADGGGRDGQVVPDMDAGDPVSVCAAADDCDDGDYCNGVETCAPGEDGAGADGCIPGTGPCADGESCDEDANQCISADCTEPDADMDGHDRIGCGSGDDCDDNDANRYPGNPEICDTEGHDEDCNPETITDNPDADGDTHIDDACFNLRDDGTENRGRDCNDARNTVNPDAAESCNGVDDDCDGMIDEGVLTTFYQDVDGDNAGNDEVTTLGCTADAGYVLDGGDCDDTDREINPSASESCNGIDDNCDGMTDPGCECTTEPPRPCGPPEAGTGSCQAGTQACVDGAWETACSGAVYPSSETCNAGDEDCDGLTNDDDPDIAAGGASVGGGVFFEDSDGDGVGGSTTQRWCVAPANWVNRTGDCADGDSTVNPDAGEICNGIDDDCSGTADDRPGGCACINGQTRPCSTDVGACTAGVETCITGEWGACSGQLAGTEVCDGMDRDEDCDSLVDEGLRTVYYFDGDSDGYGDPMMPRSACTQEAQYVLNNGDCNDADDDIPAPGEICDGVDNDCDGVTDPGCACTQGDTQPCGIDVGACEFGTQTCSASGTWGNCVGGTAPVAESCGGGDEDCDGMTDEPGAVGGIRCYRDNDGDGYGIESHFVDVCACSEGYVSRASAFDCRDSNDDVHPGQRDYFLEPFLVRPPHCIPDLGCFDADYSWDYDCDGTVERQPAFICPGYPCALGQNGPTSSHAATPCGTDVPHTDCGWGCDVEQPAGDLPLRCH